MATEQSSQETAKPASKNIDVFDMPVGDVNDIEFADGDEGKEKTAVSKGGDQIDLSSLPPTEVHAREGGWLPKQDFVKAGGDGDDWVSAKVFNERGDIFDSVKKTNKEVAYLKRQLIKRDKALRALGEHNQKLGQVEYEKALATLKEKKVEALRAGDFEDAVDIDEKIATVKENEISAEDLDLGDEETVNNATPPQAWVDYESDNKFWYGKNQIMTGAANNLVAQYIQENGIDGVPTPEEVKSAIAYMDAEIRDAFPHKFTKENSEPNTTVKKVTVVKPKQRGNNSAVEAGQRSNTRTNQSTGTSQYTQSDLTESQLSIAKTFVASGAMKSVQAYVDQLAEIGGIVES